MLFNMADKYFGLHRWLWEQSDKDCEGGVGEDVCLGRRKQ